MNELPGTVWQVLLEAGYWRRRTHLGLTPQSGRYILTGPFVHPRTMSRTELVSQAHSGPLSGLTRDLSLSLR